MRCPKANCRPVKESIQYKFIERRKIDISNLERLGLTLRYKAYAVRLDVAGCLPQFTCQVVCAPHTFPKNCGQLVGAFGATAAAAALCASRAWGLPKVNTASPQPRNLSRFVEATFTHTPAPPSHTHLSQKPILQVRIPVDIAVSAHRRTLSRIPSFARIPRFD